MTSQITRNSLRRNKSHVRNNCIKVVYRKAQFEEIEQNAAELQRLIMGMNPSESVIRRITFHVMCDVIRGINQK